MNLKYITKRKKSPCSHAKQSVLLKEEMPFVVNDLVEHSFAQPLAIPEHDFDESTFAHDIDRCEQFLRSADMKHENKLDCTFKPCIPQLKLLSMQLIEEME